MSWATGICDGMGTTNGGTAYRNSGQRLAVRSRQSVIAISLGGIETRTDYELFSGTALEWPGTMRPGLYEQLLTVALQNNLEGLVDPRLSAVAPVSADEAHAVLAQFLEHLLFSGLATYRGAEASEKQQRLVERVLATLAEELGADWLHQLSIATPLRRLLAVHVQPRDGLPDRPDTQLARSALLTGETTRDDAPRQSVGA